MSLLISAAAVERAFESFALAMRRADAEVGADPQYRQSLTLVLSVLKTAIALEALAEPMPKQPAEDEFKEQLLVLSVAVIAMCDFSKCWRWTFSEEEIAKCGSVSGREVSVERKGGDWVLKVEKREVLDA